MDSRREKANTVRGDLAGGVVSAIIALPGNMVFGLIAFAPLGEAYAPQGILAAMYCSIFAGTAAALLGGTPSMITGPKAPLAVVFATALMHGAALPQAVGGSGDPISTALWLAFAAVFCGGVLQLVFGATGLGSLIKYIPYPVIAGLLNGTAILIILSQVWAFLGIARQPSLWELGLLWTQIKPLNLVVGLFTAAAVWFSPRILPRIPGSITGLAAGCGLYYALAAAGWGDLLGPLIGKLPSALPGLGHLPALSEITRLLAVPGCLPALAAAAFSLAILGSTESLLTSAQVGDMTGRRTEANRELLGQGAGNMLAACFGGLSGGGILVRSRVNLQSGGDSRLSGLVHGTAVFLCVYLLASFIGGIPQVVMAGVVLVIALEVFDRWSLQLMLHLSIRRRTVSRELISNCLVVVLVMLVTAFFNLIAAVALGIAVSVLMFLEKVSRSVVRRVVHGSAMHSRKQRHPAAVQCLREKGDRICLLELEGSLFFGSADLLASEIERLGREGARHFILDVRRLTGIDSTGVRILQQIHGQLARLGREMALAGLHKQPALEQLFTELGAARTLGAERLFEDSDLALEYFEDRLLARTLPEALVRPTISLPEHPLLAGLDAGEMETIQRHARVDRFAVGDTIFHQGDAGDGLYLVTRGSAEVSINLAEEGRRKRLLTFSVGTVFGEMALLDGSPRSATVIARDELVCHRVSLDDFLRLQERHPRIAIVLLTNLGKVMSSRLRAANDMVSDLEQ